MCVCLCVRVDIHVITEVANLRVGAFSWVVGLSHPPPAYPLTCSEEGEVGNI